jgi:type I restriction enzyme S subunit
MLSFPEWPRTPVRDITLKTRTWNPLTEPRETIRYVDVSAFSRETLEIGSVAELPSSKAPSRARKIIESGDTIFATIRPGLKRVAMVPALYDDGIASTAFCVLRPNRTLIDPDFLYFVTSGDAFVEEVTSFETGASYPAVRDSDILDREILLPPLPVQKQIAQALRAVRRALLLQVNSLAVAEELKRSTMRDLFSRGLRGELQKETRAGLVPESWVPTPAERIFKLTSGKTRPNDLVPVSTADKPYPVLGGNGIMGYSAECNFESEKILIIGRVGEYCGAVHVASGKVWITDNALYAKNWLNASANVGYVAAFLHHFDLNRFKRMAGQPLVTQGMINEHSLPLPSPEEQSEIVEVFDSLDRKIDIHKCKRGLLEDLFKSLLHNLMTGEIRVTDLDLPALGQPRLEEVAA